MPMRTVTRPRTTIGALNIGSRRRAVRSNSFALIPVSASRSPTPTPRLPKPGPTQEQDAPLLDPRHETSLNRRRGFGEFWYLRPVEGRHRGRTTLLPVERNALNRARHDDSYSPRAANRLLRRDFRSRRLPVRRGGPRLRLAGRRQ